MKRNLWLYLAESWKGSVAEVRAHQTYVWAGMARELIRMREEARKRQSRLDML